MRRFHPVFFQLIHLKKSNLKFMEMRKNRQKIIKSKRNGSVSTPLVKISFIPT